MEEKASSVRSVFRELRRMIRNGVSVQEAKGKAASMLRASLDKDYLGYVLITCEKPSEEGKMEVEFSYGGEAALASFLVDSAQVYLEEQDEADR